MRGSTLTLALLLAGCATIAAVGAVAFAQEMQPPINADEVKWGPAPPNIPAGAQIAVLAGDPASDGPYVVRLKMPANYKVPAHYHPKDETVTVISGDFHVGMGDKLDMQKGLVLNPGGFVRYLRVCATMAGLTVGQSCKFTATGLLRLPTSIRRMIRAKA
jgi:hypothetical protein